MLTLLLLACAPDDDCAAMCDAALSGLESCLAAEGREWEGSGWESPEDFANWCDTWSWEQRQLGQEATCAEKLPELRDGDCDAFYAAWATP